jgi:hypothetical protein
MKLIACSYFRLNTNIPSQNVNIRDVPYSLKSPRNSECKLAHIYGMNKGKVFMSCVNITKYAYLNEF